MTPLPRSFYDRHALTVARALLGMRLVRHEPGQERIAGRIVETEAYTGLDDMASHGRKKRTPRNLPMWGPPGCAYVYLTHGIHWMFNVVVEGEDHPAAVLIRAVEPLEGLTTIAERRAGRKPLHWTSGPGRLTAAMGITGTLNRADISTPHAGLWIEPDTEVADTHICTGPRIGLGKTPEPWLSMPWRFWVAENSHVSR